MIRNDYIIIQSNNKLSLIKRESLQKLKKVDAIIFDCDGVIIDSTESYLFSIKKTANYIFNSITGTRIEENILDKLIYILKKGGGFNNDWTTTYVISLITLAIFLEKDKDKFKKIIASREFNSLSKPLEKVLFVQNIIRDEEQQFVVTQKSFQKLINLTQTISTYGKEYTKKIFSKTSIITNDLEFLESIQKFLSYNTEVGESVITTIFEEIFLGINLFKKIYNKNTSFIKDKGLIENEKLILNKKTLDLISFLIGGPNFGIASGRPYSVSKKGMGKIINYFTPKARIFLEDIDKMENEYKLKGQIQDFSKPNPFSILQCAKGLRSFKYALYLGDTIADLIMVDKANSIQSIYLFGGIYSHSIIRERQLLDFIKRGADIIIPSVVDLPNIIKIIKEEKKYA